MNLSQTDIGAHASISTHASLSAQVGTMSAIASTLGTLPSISLPAGCQEISQASSPAFNLACVNTQVFSFDRSRLQNIPELLAVFDRYLCEAKYEHLEQGSKIYVPTTFHIAGLRRVEKFLVQFLGREILAIEVRRPQELAPQAARNLPVRDLQTALPLPAVQKSLDPIEIERKRRQSPPDLISSMVFETPIALTRRWCEGLSNGARSQVLWIHGRPGSGKTALIKQLHSWVDLKHRMEFTDVMKFFQEWRRALEAKDTLAFVRKFRKETHILVLENLDELETKEKTQQEVLFTINAILDAGGSIAVTSSKHPMQLKETLSPALYSRLFSGLILEMPAPDRGFKENLWRKLLETYGMGDSALDMRATEQLLSMEVDSIRKAHTLFINAIGRLSVNKELSPADLQEIQSLHGASTNAFNASLAPTETLDKVARLCGVTRAAILGKVRRSDISLARRFACLALARFNGLTNSSIANLIEKDPSTVSHALKSIEVDLDSHRNIREQWNWLCSEMGVAHVASH